MAEWRQRGYVPDSDDEGEECTQSSPHRPIINTTPQIEQEEVEPGPGNDVDNLQARANEPESNLSQQEPPTPPADLARQNLTFLADGNGGSLLQTFQDRESNILSGNGEGRVGSLPEQDSEAKIHAAVEEEPESSVAKQLQQELRSGLDVVRGILTEQPEVAAGQFSNGSDSSSPLSSVRSSAINSQFETFVSNTAKELLQSADEQFEGQHFTEPTGSWADALAAVPYVERPFGRNLRQRNAIQVHPYALEGARYQRELLARGLKPLSLSHLHRQGGSAPFRSQDFDSRSTSDENEEGTPSQLDSYRALQPVSNHAVRKRFLLNASDAIASDEELPDLGDLLEGQSSHLRGAQKLRSISHIPKDPKPLDKENRLGAHDLPPGSAGLTPRDDLSDDIFHVPLSPPNSRHHHSSQSSEIVPQPFAGNFSTTRLTPKALPTPNVSSAPPQQGQPPLPANDDFDSQARDKGGTSSASPQELSERGTGRLFRLQRKTKGVLPASFFRLQNQRESRETAWPRSRSLSLDRDDETPGVARRLPQTRRLQGYPSLISPAFFNSDESHSDEDRPSLAMEHQQVPDLAHRHDDIPDLVYADIEEDNSIDRMFQPHSRARKPLRSGKKRQRRIKEFVHHSEDCFDGELSQTRMPKKRKLQIRRESGLQRRRHQAPRRKPTQGPLDAPDYRHLPRVEQPHFLRVAMRRARPRRNGARQSSSRKFLRLTTSADTQEVNTALSNCSNGLIRQNSAAALRFPGRKPLQPRSASHNTALGRRLNTALVAFDRKPHQSVVNTFSVRPIAGQESSLADNLESFAPKSFRRRMNQADPSSHTSPIPTETPTEYDGITPHFSTTLQNQPRDRAGGELLFSSAKNTARYRDAQHENASQRTPRERIVAAFRGRSERGHSDKVLDRASEGLAHRAPRFELSTSSTFRDALQTRPITRKPRKRPVRQVSFDRLEPAWPAPDEQVYDTDSRSADTISGVVLAGLGSPDSTTSHDFGVSPFPEGTRIHKATFVGEGHLSLVVHRLVCQPRNFLLSVGETIAVSRPSSGAAYFNWGVWNNQVAQQFDVWFEELGDCLSLSDPQNEAHSPSATEQCLIALTSLTTYFYSHISFLNHDAVVEFVGHASSKLQRTVAQIGVLIEGGSQGVSRGILPACCLLIVILFEAFRIAALTSINVELRTGLREAYKSLAVAVLKANFQEGHLDSALKPSITVGGGSDVGFEHPSAEILVVLHHLGKQQCLDIDIWDLTTEALEASIGTKAENSMNFQEYDQWWKGVFSSLPLLEFDLAGLSRRKAGPPGWDLVQRLLARFMCLYLPRRRHASLSTKSYGRILLRRCLDLVQLWGWQGGHSAIGALFDAYSSNDMGELFGETPDHHFSIPVDLGLGGLIHVSKLASGFHIFLGLATQTILDCLKAEADPKLSRRVLRSLCARLVPTRGEELSRNRYPHRHDVIALRNRFDLISVMFCAMPIEMKSSLRLFQSLVNFRNSHREACKLALECWSQLVQHVVNAENAIGTEEQQLSQAYAADTLPQLSKWSESMVLDLLAEYASNDQQGLSLGEQDHSGNPEPRYILIDGQKPIVESLKEVLRVCEQILHFCHTERQARSVFNKPALGQVLTLFDGKEPAVNTTVSLALQIVVAYSHKCVPCAEDPPADEESQEYGSWDHFAGMETDDQDLSHPDQEHFAYLLHEVQPMLLRFLSNVLGSDVVPDHAILKTTTDCWFEVADALVRAKARSWNDYLGPYSSNSWASLRDTQQSRQYGVLFLAKVVDSDCGFYDSNRVGILDLWISALCRPDALLCWEHSLTSTILFHDSESELLFNAPFVVRSDAGRKLEIPMVELRDRRRALIYVILRNMHRLLTAGIVPLRSSATCSKADFSAMLKGMQKTMKAAYQDLEADSSSQVDYRAFVNFVIQQMQVYVADFHRIDPFFTDPTTFSVEEHAVTAALKRHSLTLESSGITKAIVLFLYNASERAAISDDQESLVLQLQNAFLDLSQDAVQRIENHDTDAALLTSFLEHVFPAYIAQAFSEPGHMIAGPMLQALRYIYQNLRCRADLWEPKNLNRLIVATEAILQSALFALKDSNQGTPSASPQHAQNFNCFVELIHAAMLRTYDVFQSFPEILDLDNLIETILLVKDRILAVEAAPEEVDMELLDPNFDGDPEPGAINPIQPSPISIYTDTELRNALDRTWRRPAPPAQHGPGAWQIVSGRGAPRLVKASIASGSRHRPAAETAAAAQETSRFVVREFVEDFVRLDGWWGEY